MEELEKYRNKVKPGRDTRLFNEWEKLNNACMTNDVISYSVNETNASGLPVVYDITFYIKSITGVENADTYGIQKPVFGEKHILSIRIPNNYPASDSGCPEFKFITDVWHPNVRYFGDFKGRVCLNLNDCGTSVYLTEHIATIAGYLRYSDYHARNEHPYPEDQTVAKWVLEQAEPHGWLNF
jgi:ubiquitin-protein ligase